MFLLTGVLWFSLLSTVVEHGEFEQRAEIGIAVGNLRQGFGSWLEAFG